MKKNVLKIGAMLIAFVIGFILTQKLLGTEKSDLPPNEIATSKSSTGDLEKILKNGDVIFQTSLSTQSKAIQEATTSKFSHVGVVLNEEGHWWVYEAVQPFRKTAVREWIERGEESKYAIKRLKDSTLLTTKNIEQMLSISEAYLGSTYDPFFEWSDERIYCSEFVWKLYDRAANIELSTLTELSSFNLEGTLVKNKLKERFADNVPLNEKVVSPAALYNSLEMKLVFSSYKE